MQQPAVLIVSDEASFANAVTGRWQGEREVPAFTLMSSDLCQSLDPETFDMAIVASLRPGTLASVRTAVEIAGKPAVFVFEENCPAQQLREARLSAMVLRQHEGWLDVLVLLGSEVLRRCEAEARAQRAEQASEALTLQATLGRYILEMRHNLNNALTSVLGNSELMMEPGVLPPSARAQAETIHSMTLRMHEILQRLSSLEKELQAVSRESQARSATATR